MVWIAGMNGNNTTQNLFTSIPQTFTHLQMRIFSRTGTGYNFAQDFLFMRFNSDAGNNYAQHGLEGDGSSATSYGAASQSFARLGNIPANSAASGLYGVSIVDILDYTNTNKNKTVRAIAGNDRNGAGTAGLYSSLWLSTAAITSITVGAANYFDAVGSRFDLYGITTSSVMGA
jgi:hypothetical protein